MAYLMDLRERVLAQAHYHSAAHRYTPDRPAADYSGLITGAIFMMLEMIMVPLFLGGSAWSPTGAGCLCVR
jgi:hypothetical protein